MGNGAGWVAVRDGAEATTSSPPVGALVLSSRVLSWAIFYQLLAYGLMVAMAAALQWSLLLGKLGQTASALDEQVYIQIVEAIIYI
jgi:hypothetical protein